MPIARRDMLALYLELTNEATVVAQAMDDKVLSSVASVAALAAGQEMGLSDAQVLKMQRDMLETLMGGPPGLRIAPDLEGPSTAKIFAARSHANVSDPDSDVPAIDRAGWASRRH